MQVPIPPPLAAEVGGVISGLARFEGGVGLRWDRPEAPVTDPMSVNDTVKVENGRSARPAPSPAACSAGSASTSRSRRRTPPRRARSRRPARGTLNASGEVTRNGVNGQWTGGIKWDLQATGTLTAAASGYFEWKVLWFEGREEIFKLESFPLGTITVRLGGELKAERRRHVPDARLRHRARQPARGAQGRERRTAPAGGGQPQVAPKRMSADVPPPEDPEARRQPARAQRPTTSPARSRRAGGQPGRAPARRRAPVAPAPGRPAAAAAPARGDRGRRRRGGRAARRRGRRRERVRPVRGARRRRAVSDVESPAGRRARAAAHAARRAARVDGPRGHARGDRARRARRRRARARATRRASSSRATGSPRPTACARSAPAR